MPGKCLFQQLLKYSLLYPQKDTIYFFQLPNRSITTHFKKILMTATFYRNTDMTLHWQMLLQEDSVDNTNAGRLTPISSGTFRFWWQHIPHLQTLYPNWNQQILPLIHSKRKKSNKNSSFEIEALGIVLNPSWRLWTTHVAIRCRGSHRPSVCDLHTQLPTTPWATKTPSTRFAGH